MKARRAVIIDTDPGIDDAIAILLALACPELDVLGLTSVAGNIGIETTTRNAGKILTYADRTDIPVIAGAAGPLQRQGFDETAVHGNDGLGGVALPAPAMPHASDAIGWLAIGLTVLPAGTIDVLALGPLTNIARLIELHPEAAKRIGRVIAMGGAIHEKGNVGPHSEFNVANDPEAADIVFRSGISLTMIPLDVTRKVRANSDFVAALRASGTKGAALSAQLIEAYFNDSRESRPLHDPCVVIAATRPDLFRLEGMAVSVDQSHGPDAGALTVSETGTPVEVAMNVDAEKALAFMQERLSV